MHWFSLTFLHSSTSTIYTWDICLKYLLSIHHLFLYFLPSLFCSLLMLSFLVCCIFFGVFFISVSIMKSMIEKTCNGFVNNELNDWEAFNAVWLKQVWAQIHDQLFLENNILLQNLKRVLKSTFKFKNNIK